MRRNLPPLNWLRTFEAAARHLSFTRAASELNLTQAAISKQIKLLEQQLGEPLFQRKARSLVLTRVGTAYLPRVKDALELLAEGTYEVFGDRRSDVLTIRVTIGFSVSWLGPRLADYYQKNPDRPLRIVSSVWNDAFNRERFDLDIRYGNGEWPGFQADRLTWDSLIPLCSPSLLQGDVPLKSPNDLQHHNLLHVMGFDEGWAVWLKAAGIPDFSVGPGFQFDSSLVAFEVAAKGLGVALGRSSTSARERMSGRLVAPFDFAVPIDEAFYLISPADVAPHPHAEHFRQWLLEEAMIGHHSI